MVHEGSAGADVSQLIEQGQNRAFFHVAFAAIQAQQAKRVEHIGRDRNLDLLAEPPHFGFHVVLKDFQALFTGINLPRHHDPGLSLAAEDMPEAHCPHAIALALVFIGNRTEIFPAAPLLNALTDKDHFKGMALTVKARLPSH